MKFKFEKLIPNDKVKAIVEVYENDGYSLRFSYTNEIQEWKSYNLAITVILEKGNIQCCLQLPKEWFKEKEPLKPYVWYQAEEFDGNPADYYILQSSCDGYIRHFLNVNELSSNTSHFMYIERLKDK